MIERLFRNHPYETQFWGYEMGNVLAALAAVGGLGGLWSAHSLDPALLAELAMPVALALLILAVALGSRLLQVIDHAQHIPALNRTAAILGCALLVWALLVGESWLSTAAVAFLTGSALIRLTEKGAAFLKLGAFLLVLGGLALSLHGVRASASLEVVNILTALTGLYVAGAGVLTYMGGVAMSTPSETGTLARILAYLDQPLGWTARNIVEPSIFWVSADEKTQRPFMTSMWARLPFRLATACAALLTLTPAGILFAAANLLWAVGDIAIGALDWTISSPEESGSEELVA